MSVSAAGWPATAEAGVRLGGWAQGGVKGLVRLSQFYELLTPLTPAGVGRGDERKIAGVVLQIAAPRPCAVTGTFAIF